MMELKLLSENGSTDASVAVSDALFGHEVNTSLIHQVVTAYMANARTANRAQKGRSEINKTKHKPWRQKGTGRARAGKASSPLWRGGGRIFPNSPDENFSQKVNRKMYRAGMVSILSQLVREDRIRVIDDFKLESPKTKLLAQKIKSMGISDSVLVITDSFDENLLLSSRNLLNVLVVEPRHADPVSLLHFGSTVMTRGAVAKIEEMLA
jgi:large subunit ribosomal protein L4